MKVTHELETVFRSPSITLIGVGGAGAAVLNRLEPADRKAIHVALVHTNARVLEQASCAVKLLLGTRRLRGLGAGGDPEVGRAAAEEETENLKSLCVGSDLVLILAGLGGGTATGVAPVLARAARETGALVLGFVALPFEFEGTRRSRQAQTGLQQLRGAADGVIGVPNEKVCSLFDESTRALDVFNGANELWVDGVRGLLRMFTQRGLIDVDFSDLAGVLRGRHSESCFATAEATGDLRGKEIIEKLLAHPFLDRGQALADADALIVTLTGGPDLTITEVKWVMDQLRRQPEDANLITGATIDENFTGKLAVTVIAAKHGKGVSLANGTEDTSDPGATPLIETPYFGAPVPTRPASRFVPPPPDLSPEKASLLFAQQGEKSARRRRSVAKMKQSQLPLEIISKGRFEKSEPTIRHGEDLDVPTYIRRGIKLN